jgi:hypothetical protein
MVHRMDYQHTSTWEGVCELPTHLHVEGLTQIVICASNITKVKLEYNRASSSKLGNYL